MKVVETEVSVIGAGPAGSTVARLLAELGHTVLLVEQSQFPRRRIGESFPPSILRVFDALGLRAAIERAGFLRPTGTIVDWSSDGTGIKPMARSPSPANGKRLVDPGAFHIGRDAGSRARTCRCIGPAGGTARFAANAGHVGLLARCGRYWK